MKLLTLLSISLLFCFSCIKQKEKPTVKSLLLEQLKNSHAEKDWYVPLNIALEGLTSRQAAWMDTTQNHSICQLVSHLIFWNERILTAFNGHTPPEFNDDNDATFLKYCQGDWEGTVTKLDSIQTSWEYSVEHATNEQLDTWGSSIANISSHNAYHTGQIIYIRKANNWWDKSKGVK